MDTDDLVHELEGLVSASSTSSSSKDVEEEQQLLDLEIMNTLNFTS